MPDNYTKIKKNVEVREPLTTRQDKDRGIQLMTPPYVMTMMQNKKEVVVPDIINVTMPTGRNFADRAMGTMRSDEMKTIIKGEGLSDEETTHIEQFKHDIFTTIDEQLIHQGKGNLKDFNIEQICIRGGVGSRYVQWKEGDRMGYDLLPCDVRNLPHEFGVDGLLWAASQDFRTAEMIKSQYPDWVGTGEDIEVSDFWDSKVNELYIAGQEYRGQCTNGVPFPRTNPLGYPPFVIVGSGAGSYLQDKDSMKYRWESIFAPIRHLLPEENRLATILSNLTMLSFLGPYQKEGEPPEESIWGFQKVLTYEGKTRGYTPLEIHDIKQATRLQWAMISQAIQRGSFSSLEYGNLTFPLSAVAIERMRASKELVFIPRLEALSYYYRALFRMMIDQFIKGGIPAELGEEGAKTIYSPSDFKKNFTIQFEFYPDSPEHEMAKAALGREQESIGISKHTIFTKTLKLQDPMGEMMKSDSERVAKENPFIRRFRDGLSLIEQADKMDDEAKRIEVKVILGELKVIWENIGGTLDEGKKKTQPKSMLPLFGGGSAPIDEEETPEPEELLNKEERRSETVKKNAEES